MIKDKKKDDLANAVTAISSACPWRQPGIKYKKNEVLLDAIEKLNMLIGSDGSVIKSEIIGSVKVKCNLSGMPELRLGLNDKAYFEA